MEPPPTPGPDKNLAYRESEAQHLLRLAVISSPRSGNTWVRCLLGSIFELEQMVAHRPEEVAWEALSPRCVLQLHWHPNESFVTQLRRYGFRVVVLARHPFDVLISSLNYSYYVHLEGRCSGGGACPSCSTVGPLPRSSAHLDFACGECGRRSYSISTAWWPRPDVVRVRYEELVAAPEEVLARLAREIGQEPRQSIAAMVGSTSIDELKPGRDVWHYHYWQGRPGLWRSFLPAEEARRIAAANPEPFAVLGYACDPDESLDGTQADLNWLHLQLDSTRENLAMARAKHRWTVHDLAAVQAQRDQILAVLWSERQEFGEARAEGKVQLNRVLQLLWSERLEHAHTREGLDAVEGHLERSLRALQEERAALAEARARLAPVEGCGAAALAVARRLTEAARRYPLLASSFRRLIRGGGRSRIGAVPSPEGDRTRLGVRLKRGLIRLANGSWLLRHAVAPLFKGPHLTEAPAPPSRPSEEFRPSVPDVSRTVR